MITLYQFQNERVSQALSDYLNKIAIKNHIEQNGEDFLIRLEDDAQHSIAQQELDLFLKNPNANKYLSASWQTGTTDRPHDPHAFANSNFMANFIQHGGILTHSIFFICIVIFVGIYLQVIDPTQSILGFYHTEPFDLLQFWRFITPVFLHFSVLHITFNLLWWWQIAGIIEKRQGTQRLAFIFIFSAFISNLAQYLLVGPNFGGLSGVVYGIVGYIWLYGLLNKKSLVNLSNAMFIFLMAWLVLGFVNILPINIANYAHLAGLISGLIIAFIASALKLKDL
ncbi:MAG: rhomboid family intramembrane serine protease GlpG [Psychromonas sp.]|nr:rhomboid family intramembrane serine protease GlpG [Psychromonas sp.]